MRKSVLIMISLLFMLSCSHYEKQTLVDIPPIPIMDETPSDPAVCLVQEQQIKKISQLVSQKRYELALDQVSTVLSRPCSQIQYGRALELAGDIFSKRSEPVNALSFYKEAILNGKGEPGSRLVMAKMVTILSQMEARESLSLIRQMKDQNLIAGLLIDTGMTLSAKGKSEAALIHLNEHISLFPDGQDVDRASAAVKEIRARTEFKRDRIGLLLPLSGYYGPAGQKVLEAVQLAVDRFARIPGNPAFRLSVRDTGSDPGMAEKAFDELKPDRPACVIGPMAEASSAALRANASGVPMIVLSQKTDVPVGGYVLRNFMTPVMQVRAGLEYYSDNLELMRVSILYPDEKYGLAFRAALESLVPEYGVFLADAVPYDPSQTDFSDEIGQLIKGYQRVDDRGNWVDLPDEEEKERNKIYRAKVDFDVLFIPDTAGMVSMIAPQLKYYGIETRLMGTNLLNSAKLMEAAEYVEGAVFPDGFCPDSDSVQVTEFKGSYLEMTGTVPEYPEAVAYDTTMMVMQALSSPHVNSGSDLVSYLKSHRFSDTVTCPVSFDAGGEPSSALDLYEVRSGQIIRIFSCSGP